MQIFQQVLFALAAAVAIAMFTIQVRRIRFNILLGRDQELAGSKSERIKNVLLLAFGQKKMFRKPVIALMHLIIYLGFIIINIEVLEIVLDGLLGSHRLFVPILGSFYSVLINSFEVLALGVLLTCVVFLLRRTVFPVKRLSQRDLNGWPAKDGRLILITEIVLMSLFLTMNASDTLLQIKGAPGYADHQTGNFVISSFLHPLFNNLSIESLTAIERTAWWLHILGIFAFLNYLPYSKHLHILLAFPNAYYARQEAMGKMNNMPAIQQEVLYAMQPELAPTDAAAPAKFGAKDVMDLSWRNLLDAYSCTECGRCTAACPANITGKKLSPRKIMMDTRDRLEEVGNNIRANKEFKEDGKSLLHDYITVEELNACTTCNACVQECPVAISPLEIILELRRSLIMEESNAPQEWNMMFSNIENNFAPWKFSPDDRDTWTEN
ncbi:MAG TPA: (Fe-S)-binding protein [Parasegetibacter sp.]